MSFDWWNNDIKYIPLNQVLLHFKIENYSWEVLPNMNLNVPCHFIMLFGHIHSQNEIKYTLDHKCGYKWIDMETNGWYKWVDLDGSWT
jgi:hypothetical protein